MCGFRHLLSNLRLSLNNLYIFDKIWRLTSVGEKKLKKNYAHILAPFTLLGLWIKNKLFLFWFVFGLTINHFFFGSFLVVCQANSQLLGDVGLELGRTRNNNVVI